MDIPYFITSLDLSGRKIKAALKGVTEAQSRWKPRPAKWSLLEVVSHLFDEERDDFRRLIDHVLHSPDAAWPSVDPEKWAVDREYMKNDYVQTLEKFLQERVGSLEWLKGLPPTNWSRVCRHPTDGARTASDFLAAWAAHDYLHLRQIADLYAGYLNIMAAPFSTAYAE
jgi:hypothetical protein